MFKVLLSVSFPVAVTGHGYVIARTGPGSQQDYAARFNPGYPSRSGQEPQSSNSPNSWCGHAAYSTEKGVGWSWPTGGPMNPFSGDSKKWMEGSLKVGQERGFKQIAAFNEDIDFEFIITAQHGGHHQLLAKCLDNPSDNDWVRLPRSRSDEGFVNYSPLYPFYTMTPKSNSCNYNGRNYWGEGPHVTYKDASGRKGSYPRYKARYYFPKKDDGEIKAFNNGRACDHATIQWKWITANSCVSPEFCVPSWNQKCDSGDMVGRNWNDLSKCDSGSTMGACGGYTDDKVAETFRNCIDMMVTGGAQAPQSTTSAPTTQEEKPETIATTTAAPEVTEKEQLYMPKWRMNSNGGFDCTCEKAQFGVVGKAKCEELSCKSCESSTSAPSPAPPSPSPPSPAPESTTRATTRAPTTTQAASAKVYYDKAWGYNSRLGGHACACKVVSWSTQFTSASSCAEAWSKQGGCKTTGRSLRR